MTAVSIIILTCPAEQDGSTLFQDFEKSLTKQDGNLQILRSSYRARIYFYLLTLKFTCSAQTSKKAITNRHDDMMQVFTQGGSDLSKLTTFELLALYLIRKRALLVEPLPRMSKYATTEYLEWSVNAGIILDQTEREHRLSDRSRLRAWRVKRRHAVC